MQANTMTSASILRFSHAENTAAKRHIEDGTGISPADLAVDSRALLQGQKAVSISHNGSMYRLQATKLGKLILTK